MRQWLFIALFVVPAGFIYGQAIDTNKTDANGRKQGLWKKYDENRQLKYVGHFRDGIPVDTFRYFYPDGNIKTVMLYSDNGVYAKAVTYYPDKGCKMAEGAYKNKEKEGKWLYYNEDTVMVAEEFYVNGKKNGIAKSYYPEGGINEELGWKDGVRHGVWYQYYPDGALKLEAGYDEGFVDGPFIAYYDSAKVVHSSGTYKKSLKEGEWLYYTEKKETIKKEIYKGGELIKEETYIDLKEKGVINDTNLRTNPWEREEDQNQPQGQDKSKDKDIKR